jgi:hypothetical protein
MILTGPLGGTVELIELSRINKVSLVQLLFMLIFFSTAKTTWLAGNNRLYRELS